MYSISFVENEIYIIYVHNLDVLYGTIKMSLVRSVKCEEVYP